eukprot:7065306-Pyramimonas_sp.AAC.1
MGVNSDSNSDIKEAQYRCDNQDTCSIFERSKTDKKQNPKLEIARCLHITQRSTYPTRLTL